MAGTPPTFYPYENASDLVRTQIDRINDIGTETLGNAQDAINELGKVSLPGEGTVPEFNLDAIHDPTIERPAPPSSTLFGLIDDLIEPDFNDFQSLITGLDLAGLPVYDPPITTFIFPPAPSPIDTSGGPTRPTINDVAVPSDPNASIPEAPNQIPIEIGPNPVIVLPTFDDIDVTFDGTAVDTVMHWAEPTYSSATLTDLTATIRRWLAGGTGMTPEVEVALFDRARDKLDATALKRVMESADTFAAKGWFLPPGAMVEQINVAQQESQQLAADLATDILTKSAEWEQENMRAAVAQGIALEGALIQQFENAARRLFDGAKAHLDADVAMFGQYVALFNARQTSRQIAVAVFEGKLKAALSRLEVRKQELEAERIKGQINETTARVYATQMEGVRTIVSIFEARVNAAKIRSDLERNKIEVYKVDTEAFATRINARKVEFDAYEAQMRGEGVKGQILESYARGFAATVDGINGTNNAKVNVIRAKIEALQAGVAKFSALLAARRDRIGAQGEAVRARASSFSADIQRFSAELQQNTELARLTQSLGELRLRNNLAYYEIRTKEYDSAMTRNIERARVTVSALSAAGSMASQLAAGAMSAAHVSASLSGSGSSSTSDTFSISNNYNYDVE